MSIEPITQEEKMLDAIAKGTPTDITPITREEMFLAKASGADIETPQPITRKEIFLSRISSAGGGTNPDVPDVPSGGDVEIVPWSTGTDEQIAAMLDAAKAGTIDLQTDGGWQVGDVRTIQISAFTDGSATAHEAQSIDIVISSFEDYNNSGSIMQFDFKDALATGVRMNSTNTNKGGYGATEMYKTTLPALVNALPEWLRTRLLEFSVLASAGSRSSTIETVTGNKLALRSEVEIFGTRTYSAAGEGTRIEYYKTAANRIKKRGHNGSASYWWERSPCTSNYYFFCNVDSDVVARSSSASVTYGVAPFGCI